MEANAHLKLIGQHELAPKKGIRFHPRHLWRLRKAGKFPKPIKLGGQRIAYVEAEIDAWIEQRIAERDAGAKA